MTAVHPWLMGLRSEILLAKSVAQYLTYPESAGMAWMVDGGPEHMLEEKQSWIERHRPPSPPSPSTAAFLARLRADRNG